MPSHREDKKQFAEMEKYWSDVSKRKRETKRRDRSDKVILSDAGIAWTNPEKMQRLLILEVLLDIRRELKELRKSIRGVVVEDAE